MDHGVRVGELQDLALATEGRNETGRSHAVEERRGAFFPPLQFGGESHCRFQRRVSRERIDGIQLTGNLSEDASKSELQQLTRESRMACSI